MPLHYVYLIVAVMFETVGTTALQASQQFTRAGPTIIVVFAYLFAFFFLGLALKYIPVGVAYAIWSGLGIVLIAGIDMGEQRHMKIRAHQECKSNDS